MQASASTGFQIVTRCTAIGGGIWRPEHAHSGFELSYVEHGQLEFRTEFGPHQARPGECVVLAPGVANRPRLSGRLTQLHLAASEVMEAEQVLGVRYAKPQLSSLPPTHPTTRLLALIASCAQQLPPGDAQLEALARACTLSLLPRGTKTASEPRDASIRTALDFIHDKLREPLSVDAMASAAGLSRYVFLRKFRAQAGTSPYRYLLERRLDCARELLRSGEHSVLSVALELEFKDPGRFSRAFRQRFGVAPSEVAKR